MFLLMEKLPSFSRNAKTISALNVQPLKGKAMIFYMINPDGNLDLTQHTALPLLEGEKYFVNLRIKYEQAKIEQLYP
jgi:hypothetical protein